MRNWTTSRLTLGACGLVLVFVFQNCSPTGLEVTALGSNSSLNTGSTNVSDEQFENSKTFTLRSLSVNAENCAADDSKLVLEIKAGGPDVEGCIEPIIAGRPPFVCSDNDFVRISTRPEWLYSPVSDVWSYSVSLKNSPVYVPGMYVLHSKSKGARYRHSIEVKNPVNSASCSGTASASAAPSCAQLDQTKIQCDEYTAETDSACSVVNQKGGAVLYTSVGFGPAKVLYVNCPVVAAPTPSPTPGVANPTAPPSGGSVNYSYNLTFPWGSFSNGNTRLSARGMESYVVKVFTNNAAISGGQLSASMTSSNSAYRVISISMKAGDFNVPTSCKSAALNVAVLRWSHDDLYGHCKLQRNATYYINISHQYNGTTTCSNQSGCDFYFNAKVF